MKKWEVKHEIKKFTPKEIVNILLLNRGIKTKKETEEFLNPKLSKVTLDSVKIKEVQVKKAVQRIKKAVKNKEGIIIFGDYDVDGICGTAILWETLNQLDADVLPYIPSRIEEGYGLSVKGITNLLKTNPGIKLIITVDNGIVANNAVDFANEKGIDVVVTDHHVPSENLPKAFAIVHTTLLCGTGVAYMLSKEFKIRNNEHLGLVALATVADLVPLTGANRIFLKYGLEVLHETKRIGLLELFREAQLDKKTIGVYEIGHMIAPRLNATGRIDSAMESLRLICTTSRKRAEELADKIGITNKERQNVTDTAVSDAKEKVRNSKKETEKLLFVYDEKYEQGVIGLVAGKLVEEFYRPSIVVSKGKIYSKASARSISGFNIIEFIRTQSDLLVDVGGHPMAAGFTVETSKLLLLEKNLTKKIKGMLSEDLLGRSVFIDTELPYSLINQEVYDEIQKLQPFGMRNPEPVFLTKDLEVTDMRWVGNGNKHLKFTFRTPESRFINGIYFGAGENGKFSIGDKVDVVYTLNANEWNGYTRIELKIKDLRLAVF